MQGDLRDISPIEPSLFPYVSVVIVILLIVIAVLLLIHFRRSRPVRTDPEKLWKRIIKKYISPKLFKDPKRFYYALNMMFREYLTGLFPENYSALTLRETLSRFGLSDSAVNELTEALGRIYRGDYFFPRSGELDLLNSDLKKVDAAARAIAKSIEKDVKDKSKD